MAERPQPGEIWDQKQTAAMRRDMVNRAVRVVSVADSYARGAIEVVPAEGSGRRSRLDLDSFLRRFTRRT